MPYTFSVKAAFQTTFKSLINVCKEACDKSRSWYWNEVN